MRESFHPFRSERAKAEYEAFSLERAKRWPVPTETLRLDTPSGCTFVRAAGRVSDPPLVLLPGARVSSLMWTDTIARLSAHHRTYALDIIDDAGFSVSRGGISTYADYVRWLDEVLALLVPGRIPTLIGVSLGGAIAAQYAVRFPGRLRSVVLLAPGATVLRFSPGFFVRFAVLSLPIRRLGQSPLRRTCQWLFEDAVNGDAACRVRAEQAIEDAQRVVRLFALRPPPWPPVLSDEEWGNLRVPCLFVVGENEKIYSARAAARRLRRVALRVETRIIPGAGHDLTIVDPDLIATTVLDFLEHRAGVALPA